MQTTTSDDAQLPQSTADIPFPYDISFVDSSPSDAVRFQIEEHLSRLGRFYDRITDCRVIIRIPHKHGGARFFHIHLQLDVPGKRLAVSREPEVKDEHTAVRIAIRDAFHKLTRQLEDFVKARQ
jgi:ribosome-associated translation inhibitor RaiA